MVRDISLSVDMACLRGNTSASRHKPSEAASWLTESGWKMVAGQQCHCLPQLHTPHSITESHYLPAAEAGSLTK
jgi:hypothetical protein